jgi:hypothetical protein
MKASRRSMAMLLVALVVLVPALLLLLWLADAHSHRASTYGIVDPNRAALRIENRTSDFAISRVTIARADTQIVDQDLHQEILMDAGNVLDLEPGDYVLDVYWVESGQVEAYQKKGESHASFSVSPGQAVVLRLKGGRAPGEGLFWMPPELVFK